MGRKSNPIDPDPFGELVMKAWARTTLKQRICVMDEDATYLKTLADLFLLDPDALRLACFLEFGHPSVCKPNGRPQKINYGELRDLMLAWLVDNHQETVDNYTIYVDNFQNSVDKNVDKNATYPQEAGCPAVIVDNSLKMSTYPHFIHICPVDKIY